MLSAHKVTHSYGKVMVLNGISFDLEEGLITGLIGPNGAGKSTLLHIVVGLLEASAGAIMIDGMIPSNYRYRIGFCPDDLPQAELLTGHEYLDLVTGIRRLDRNLKAEAELLEGMRLTDAAHRLIVTYSHGMKRKLQLVAALLHLPTVLVLDEPFRGLDPESSAIMKNLLKLYAARGNTVLISTHDLLVAEQLCERVLILRDGRVLADQSVAALRHRQKGVSLEEAFLRLTGLEATTENSSAQFFSGLDQLAGASEPSR